MRLHSCLIFILAGALVPTLPGCTSPPAGAGPKAAEGHAVAEREPGAGGKTQKVSDLDQPVERLLAAVCEHGKQTYECDECRYETGIVRAPERLFACGLMRKTKAERRRVEGGLTLTGEVQFDERLVAHVSSQAEGIVHKVQVTLGDRIRRGQPLVELESVAVGEAQSAHLEAQAALVLARRTYERQVRLRKELISSEKELLQATQELDAAEIRATAAVGKLTRLGMDTGSVAALTPQNAQGRLVLRAPTEGVVLAMHAVPGEVVKTEEALLTVGNNSSLWVWANLYERDVAQVKRAQARQKLLARVSVKAYPGQEFPGAVDFISPVMDEPSRTVKVRIAVSNPDGRLLAGMFANAKLLVPGEEEALVVPAGAILEDEGRSFLFLHHHGDYYVRRPVTPGRVWEGWIEVAQGLTGGETVVADGAFLMKSDVLRSKMGAGCAD
jgi:cobalt-zinc-cadmium efflux system membrane fusion protein